MSRESSSQTFASSYRRPWRWSPPSISAPSWVISAALHVGMLLALAASLRGCGTLGPEANGEGDDYRLVGLYLKQVDEKVAPSETISDSTAEDSPSFNSSTEDSAAKAQEETNELLEEFVDLPSDNPRSVIGRGPEQSAELSGDLDDILNPAGPSGASGAHQPQRRQTRYLGISDSGDSFVYVVDRSASMYDDGAFLYAKADLRASLQSLDAEQRFQIIFYNKYPEEMTDGRGPAKMYFATDVNRTRAGFFIDSIIADGGTFHKPALMLALRFEPDVIFFLTDADDILTPRDLDDVRRANRNQTRIHCIEFGKGPDLGHKFDSFLKKLARENNGTYLYRDVLQLKRQ